MNINGIASANYTKASKETVLIACSMLRSEIEKAMADNGLDVPVIWMEKGLHDKPEKLRAALQEQIDGQQDKAVILLGYCLCGNAALGLQSEKATLVIPKFDDCIRMLMSTKENSPSNVNSRCLYFTRDWMESDKFILREMEQYSQKYGEEDAAEIIELMLENYKGLCLVDTGAYEVSSYVGEAAAAADKLNLAFEVVEGSIRVLEKLFSSSHDTEFCIIPPGVPVSGEHFSGRPL